MASHSEAGPPLAAFDVGNTSVKCALLAGARWKLLFRMPTAPVETLERRILTAFPAERREELSAARCVVSSVHPAADVAVRTAWAAVGAAPAAFFGRDVSVPLPTRVLEPDKVGTDRLLLALGARELEGAPCVVVSAGTAITIDLVDAEGAFAGGAIAPGFQLAASALHEKTALLPLVELKAPPPTPGLDSARAVQAGVYWSCAGGVLALIRRYEEVTGCADIPVVCTGTDAPLLLCVLQAQAWHEPHLIFHGMAAALRAQS